MLIKLPWGDNLKVRQPFPEVVTFPFLDQENCSWLLRKILAVKIRQKNRIEPNTMNKYGTAINPRTFLDEYVRNTRLGVIDPIVKKLFPDVAPLKSHYAFVVDYDTKNQRSLQPHQDTSDITLNVCLGLGFTGGELEFTGPRGGVQRITHRVGTAIIHRGSHEHRARPIVNGHRTNLIVWCST